MAPILFPHARNIKEVEMFLNKEEERVIRKFYGNIDKVGESTLLLVWESGSIEAIFDTCFEDYNEEMGDEFYSFSFIAREVKGNPPVNISNKKFFLINYRNFPSEILCGGKLIN